jgi:hypothetical protein
MPTQADVFMSKLPITILITAWFREHLGLEAKGEAAGQKGQ